MDQLKHLGKPSSEPIDKVDLIEWAGGAVRVSLDCAEFTCLCPVTGQPDFGTLLIEYVPDRHLVETKSLKLYLWRYRNERTFNERLVDAVAEDLSRQLKPRWIRITGRFHARGGIGVTAVAERGKNEGA